MSFTTVADKAAGSILTEADWDTYIRDNLNKGVVRPVADLTLGAAAASIDFTSIAADWAHLLLAVSALPVAAGDQTLGLRFNGDTTANYDYQLLDASAATPNASESIASTLLAAGFINPYTRSGSLIFIPNYAQSVAQHAALGLFGRKKGVASGDMTVRIMAGWWRSANAINRVTIHASGGNLDVGTRATLYGMGG